uniref:Down syndrome cell adhesion molecule-like protein Dscam2 n=1 Tax=Panagrellus redivivus TaxID=6233 RepID=A0A7E4ZS71_PANRE
MGRRKLPWSMSIIAIVFIILALSQEVFGDNPAQLITGRPPKFAHSDLSRVVVQEGSPLEIKCPLVVDDFDVEWYKDGKSLDRNEVTLSLPAATRQDAGDYQCYAYNGIGGSYSPVFNATVLYLEAFDEEEESFFTTKVAPSASFVLQPPRLIASPQLKVSWRWLFDGVEVFINDTHYISSTGDLVILQASGRFGGYQIEADSEKGSAYSEKYTVIEDKSFVPPPEFSIVYHPRDVVVNAGDYPSATFECVPGLYGRYPAEIRWLLNGEVLIIDGREVRTEHANRRLVISNVVALLGRGVHSAKVACEAKAGESQRNSEAHLEVIESPQINHEALPDELVRHVGDAVNVVCKTSRAWPRAQFAWFFNKKKIVSSNPEVLRIDHLEKRQFGVYQCKSTNAAGTDTAQIWIKTDDVDVAAAASAIRSDALDAGDLVIIAGPEDTLTAAGRDVTLQCRTDDPHNTQLTWSFNGTEIPRSNPRFTSNSTTLTLHSAKKADSGVYACVARANSLTGKASAIVTVTGATLIEYGPSNQSILIGSNVHIPCKLSEEFASKGNLWTTWTRNGEEIPATGDRKTRISINGGNLMINQVGPDNIGLYTCTVKSAQGEEESTSGWLKIIEKPSMPQSVHAKLVNDTIPAKIRVSWRPGFHGNSPIIRDAIEMRTIGPTGVWSEWQTVVENVPSELCCSSLIDNIRPSSTAEFRVISFNRFGAGKPSLPSEEIEMPQQPPAAAPRSVAASARSSSSVVVQWQPPPSDQWNGDIQGYHVRYRLSGYATADWNEKNISDGNARNAVIEPLITWREYEIQVAAFNDRGLGVYSKPIDVTTLEGIPMQAPQNVLVRVLNSTAIQVSFDPPDQQMIPGVTLGYKIDLWKGPAHEGLPYRTIKIDPELSRIDEIINGLEKFGHYNLTSVCFTSPGDGPSSDAIEVITEEDTPGIVASVNFDQVMSNSVLVQWEPPTEPNGVILKYIIRHWEENRPEEKRTIEVNAEDTEVTIEGLTPSTKYFVDVQAVTKAGFGPRMDAQFESGVPPELPGKPGSLVVSDIGARSVVLQFVPGFDGHSFIKKWHVEACIGSSSIFTQIYNVSAPKARSIVVEKLRPYTKYKLRLIAENVRGRGAPSDPTRVFQTRQTEPENAPEKLFVEPISDSQISLVWTPLLSSQWNGDPSGYLIRYRAVSIKNTGSMENDSSDANGEWKEIRASSPRASDLTLTDLRPFTSYQVKIFAENTFGNSAPSETVFATTYESVPSGAPVDVEAELDRTKRAVVVTWGDIDEKLRNGVITGYIVRVIPDEARLRQSLTRQVEVVGVEHHSVVVDRLRPYTEYRIFVAATTIVGEGPQNANPPLVVTSEDVPGEPTGLAFGYVSSDEVRLKWMPPVNPNGKLLAYEVRHWQFGFEGNATTVKLPFSMFSFSATQLKPNTTYVFGVKAETIVGWGPEEIALVYTSERKIPPPVPPTPQRHPSKPPTATDIWIQWPMHRFDRELNMDDAPVRWVTLQYQKANEDEWINFPNDITARKNEIAISDLIPNTAYRVRIRFNGDFAESSWSVESEWIKTASSAPSKPPTQLQASPFESSSIMLQFTPPSQQHWNSDAVGYRILYRIYPSNESFKLDEIPLSEEIPSTGRIQHIVQKLTSFHHYVVQVQLFNSYGASLPSRPVFVYVGYSIPKQEIHNVVAEPLSSTSIHVKWDEWTATENDAISGYRVRYAPVLSVLSPEIDAEARGGESTEEIVISERNDIVLSDLRKYTEYQVSVAGYNRAGEGQSTSVRVRTSEDLPGPVGQLEFHDILLDSVNVSWTPPVQPNGRIVNYIVRYRTYKLAVGYENNVNQKTSLNYYLATKLEENSTYFFTVQAENAAGKGDEVTNNVTIGYNVGSPESPTRPTFTSEPSSFVLYWKDTIPGSTPIVGHVIQAKRIGTALSKTSGLGPFNDETARRARRDDYAEYRPQHVIGEWITISNIMGSDTSFRISYRQLEPASVYVFRVFARNQLGIGLPSADSEQLVVPESIPEDPFYTKWWFVAVVGASILLVVIIFVVTLCLTSRNNRYKNDKRRSFDSLQLADGGIASYQLAQTKNKQVRRTNEILPRPETHTSWISNDQIRDPLGSGAYGSIASGVDGVGSRANSVYRALATDNLPPTASSNRHSAVPYSAVTTRAPTYASRGNLTDVAANQRSPGFRLSEYATNHLVSDHNFPYSDEVESTYGHTETNANQEDENGNADNLARHYQVTNPTEDIYRATWRRAREQAEQQMRSPLPPPPLSRLPVRHSEQSNDTSLSEFESGNSGQGGVNSGISLRALFPPANGDQSSTGSHTPLGATAPNGFSSFV